MDHQQRTTATSTQDKALLWDLFEHLNTYPRLQQLTKDELAQLKKSFEQFIVQYRKEIDQLSRIGDDDVEQQIGRDLKIVQGHFEVIGGRGISEEGIAVVSALEKPNRIARLLEAFRPAALLLDQICPWNRQLANIERKEFLYIGADNRCLRVCPMSFVLRTDASEDSDLIGRSFWLLDHGKLLRLTDLEYHLRLFPLPNCLLTSAIPPSVLITKLRLASPNQLKRARYMVNTCSVRKLKLELSRIKPCLTGLAAYARPLAPWYLDAPFEALHLASQPEEHPPEPFIRPLGDITDLMPKETITNESAILRTYFEGIFRKLPSINLATGSLNSKPANVLPKTPLQRPAMVGAVLDPSGTRPKVYLYLKPNFMVDIEERLKRHLEIASLRRYFESIRISMNRDLVGEVGGGGGEDGDGEEKNQKDQKGE